MKQKREQQAVRVVIPTGYTQAFRYFLAKLWEDVEMDHMHSGHDGRTAIELRMDTALSGSLIHDLWEEWKDDLIYEAYAIMN